MMRYMKECIFCEIVAGKREANFVYQDEQVLAFLDLYPIRLGHTLVIPRTHYETILHISEEELAYLIKITKRLSHKIMTKLDAKGFRVSSNNYPAARQIVPHIHFHIIPVTGDEPFQFKSERIKVTKRDLEAMSKIIRSE